MVSDWLRRISGDSVIVIKAQRYRSQDKNRDDALTRLRTLLIRARVTCKTRMTTRPTRSSKRKRLKDKTQRGELKTLHGKVVA